MSRLKTAITQPRHPKAPTLGCKARPFYIIVFLYQKQSRPAKSFDFGHLIFSIMGPAKVERPKSKHVLILDVYCSLICNLDTGVTPGVISILGAKRLDPTKR